jgi:hypothetical protein
MDGRYITEARTAVSAVSTRFLPGRRIDTRDHRQRRSGAQPPRGISAGPAVEEVRIWSPKQRSREQFVET